MTQARETQICLAETPYYHCYVRCVRRAYLCGEDHSTGENYDHRKQWIASRLRYLSYIYAIDVCAYAVMSNHYHVVLHVDQTRAATWSDEEVVERWLQLYNGNLFVNRWLADPNALDNAELEKVKESVAEWRKRLCDISWFMRGVNETIARMANDEDDCKGRFWEGRFKSQALLDEAAVLSCMAYVDLNPVRAGMEKDLANSDFTSIQQRLYDYVKYKNNRNASEQKIVDRVNLQKGIQKDLDLDDQPEAPLMRFDGSSHTDIHTALPFTREDYFELVDVTGRIIKSGKRGYIASDIPSIVSQLGLNPDKWIDHIQNFGKSYAGCVGTVHKIQNYVKNFNRRWGKGVSTSAGVYQKQVIYV